MTKNKRRFELLYYIIINKFNIKIILLLFLKYKINNKLLWNTFIS
jgi:hypothetical protein